jgi:hypothetical protein
MVVSLIILEILLLLILLSTRKYFNSFLLLRGFSKSSDTPSEPGSSVSIVYDHRLDGRVRSPTEAEDFASNLCVQTGSGAHPAPYTVGTGGSFPGGKTRLGRDADHSPPSSAEVKKESELYLLSPRCASMERNGTASPFFQIHLHYCCQSLLINCFTATVKSLPQKYTLILTRSFFYAFIFN